MAGKYFRRMLSLGKRVFSSGEDASKESGDDFKRLAASRRSHDTSLLTRVRSIDAAEEYQHYIKDFLSALRTTFIGRAAGFYMITGRRGNLSLQGAVPDKLADDFKGRVAINAGIMSNVLSGNESILASILDDKFTVDYSSGSSGIKSFLGTPILYEEKPIGVLFVDSIAEKAFGDEDRGLIETYGLLLSSTLRHFDAIYDLDNRYRVFSAMYRSSTDIHGMLKKEDLLNEVAGLCERLFEFDRMTISTLKDGEPDNAVIESAVGIEDGYGEGFEYPIEDGLNGLVIKRKTAVMVPEIEEGGYFKPRFTREENTNNELHSFLGAPIAIRDQMLGVISLESRIPGRYSEIDMEILTALGVNTGTALSKLRYYSEMRRLATTDGLTNLKNYRAFTSALEDEISRAKRFGQEFSLLIVDLDHFKQVNDKYGHLTGDYVLRSNADTIAETVRTVDFVARYGGEEFAIILVETGKEAALQTAERIRSRIENSVFEHEDEYITVKASLGVATYPMDGVEGKDIVANADMAMYNVKRAGGNGVTAFSDTNIKESTFKE